MPSNPAPTTDVGHAIGLGYTWGYPIDSAEDVPELTWPSSVPILSRMRNDAKISGTLHAVTLPVRRATWVVRPNGAPDAAVALISSDLGLPIEGTKDSDAPRPRRRRRFDFARHLRTSTALSLVYGHMPYEKRYTIGDDGLAHLVALGERLPSTIAKINVDRDGTLNGIEQYPTGAPGDVGPFLSIPSDRLVMHTHEREGGLWQGRSILRSSYRHWLVKDHLIRVDAMKHERNGMGVPYFRAPANASPKLLAQLNEIGQRWRASESASVAVPDGVEFGLKGVEGSLPDTIASIRYHDEQLAEETLSTFLGLDSSQHGSRALGEALLGFFVLALQSIADEFSDTLNEQLVEPWVDWNWGEDVPAPLVVCSPIGEDQSLTAEALSALIQSGAVQPDPALDAWVRQRYRIPERDANTPWEAAPAGPSPAERAATLAAARREHDPFVHAGSDAGAPGEIVVETAPDWPGADFLAEFVDAYVPRISAALADLVDVEALASDFLSSADVEAGRHWYEGERSRLSSTIPGVGTVEAASPEATSFVASISPDDSTLAAEIRDLIGDAYIGGDDAARATLAALGIDPGAPPWGEVDWGQWEPGYTRAAAEVAGDDNARGLAGMLREADVTIKGITDTTLDRIATALSDALARGDSVATLARDLRSILSDPSRARMIAQTELARSMTVASLDTYREHDVRGKVWLLSDGACPLCEENEADGEIKMDDEFTNGDPPVHPFCVCAVGPVVGGAAD